MPSPSSYLANNYAAKTLSMVLFGDFSRSVPKRHHLSPSQIRAPLVVSMGIPVEGIGLLIAVDAIPDIFATTLNVTGDMVAAVLVSRNHVMTHEVVSVEPVAVHPQP